MKIKLPRLKRWQKAVRNLFLCVLFVFLGFFSVDFKTLSSKAAFERLADSFLIDEYNIIGTVKDSGDRMSRTERIYLAETTDYYLLGKTYQERLFWSAYSIVYEYKKEEVTIFPVPLNDTFDPCYVDLIMFTKNKEAESAKLILYCTRYSEEEANQETLVFDEEYISSAKRNEEGYFTFTIKRKYIEYKNNQYYYEQEFFEDIISYGDPIWGRENENVRMVVELYNAEGERIATEEKGRPDFD